MTDSRFIYEEPVSWKNGQRQTVFGSGIDIVKPTKPVEEKPRQVEFELDSNHPLLFGVNTRFRIQGKFERRAAAADAWESVPVGDSADVILAPNWFELMIQSIDIYHGNGVIRHHDEANFIPSLLNTYLYSRMDKTVKKFLCPEATSTGHGVPSSYKKWEFTSDEWTGYAGKVFGDDDFYFHWVPLHTFPFFQSPNFVVDPVSLKAVPPLRNLGRITCRITFREDLDCIWRKRGAANNTKTYRFKFMNMTLSLEEARLNPNLERQIYAPTGKNKLLHYPGVTKLMRAETISNQVFFHTCRFESVSMPEGIFIFAIPKKVIASTYKYSEHGAGSPVFMRHNIEKLTVEFNGEELTLKEPHFGDIKDKLIQTKYFFDHIAHPPFGLDINQEQIKQADLVDSLAETNFPSVYLNLCIEGRHRVVPLQNNAAVLSKDCDLNIGIKFVGTGATQDATYIVYLFYTDYNVVLDMRARRFYPYYNLK